MLVCKTAFFLCVFQENGGKRESPEKRKKKKKKKKNHGYSAGYNLGQNEWNISTTPPPHFNDVKMAGFGLRAPSSLLWGGRGLIVPFYSVQDFNLGQNEWNISTTPPPISMMLKWRVLVFARLHHCFGGKGVNCSFLFCPRL